MSEVIHVMLRDEGVEVWAPVEAERDSGAIFVLPASAPEGERWAFAPGSRVLCERRGADLFVTALAPPR